MATWMQPSKARARVTRSLRVATISSRFPASTSSWPAMMTISILSFGD